MKQALPRSLDPISALEPVQAPLVPSPRRLPRARSGKCPDASNGNPARDGDGHGQPQLPRDANYGRADTQGMDVVDGARVLGCEGERLHLLSLGRVLSAACDSRYEPASYCLGGGGGCKQVLAESGRRRQFCSGARMLRLVGA